MDDAEPQVPLYHRALDIEQLCRDYPPAPDCLRTTFRMSRDALRALQETRFLAQVRRAWSIPFYQRLWSAAGIRAGDIRSLDDLTRLPTFSVDDLRDSIERKPPFGDLMGIDPETDEPMPLVLQTSGGTTGLPRPMLFAPQDREVMNIMTGRRLYMQGVRAYDLVQVVFSLGLTNGGMLMREGIWKYSGAIPVMTGSGEQTSTRRQIEIIQAWKSRFLIGFSSYLRHMGLVARDELKIDPRTLGVKGLISHIGLDDRDSLEELWGADVFDNYGANEAGSIAAECRYKTGSHVFEDAFVLEINDPDTMRPVAPGTRGVVYLTSLFKHVAPLIRYNTNDVSAFARGTCPCGNTHRRLERLYGRNDNMVKLRGTNVFPEAVGALVAKDPRCNGEFICVVETLAGRDEMTVMVETSEEIDSNVERDLGTRFKEALGVTLKVNAARIGALDQLTGLSKTSKIRRLIDRRGETAARK